VAVVQKAVEKEKVAVQQASLAQKVAATIEKQAKKSINTQRGTKKEASDLEILQRTVPNVKAGNDRSYFLNVSRGDGAYGAFVIGRIDGFDHTTDTIYELKSRSSRLFHSYKDLYVIPLIFNSPSGFIKYFDALTNCSNLPLVAMATILISS